MPRNLAVFAFVRHDAKFLGTR